MTFQINLIDGLTGRALPPLNTPEPPTLEQIRSHYFLYSTSESSPLFLIQGQSLEDSLLLHSLQETNELLVYAYSKKAVPTLYDIESPEFKYPSTIQTLEDYFEYHSQYAESAVKYVRKQKGVLEQRMKDVHAQQLAMEQFKFYLGQEFRHVMTHYEEFRATADPDFQNYHDLLHSFETEVDLLGQIVVNPIIPNTQELSLSHFIPTEKVMTWFLYCQTAQEKFLGKCTEVETQLTAIQSGLYSLPEETLGESILISQERMNKMEELNGIISRDLGRVHQITKQLGPGSPRSLDALENLMKIHQSDYLGVLNDAVKKVKENSNVSLKQAQRWLETSRLTNEKLFSFLNLVEKCNTQVNTLFATLSVHQQAFLQLDHVHHVPNAWSETLYEIARRMEFEKTFIEECSTVTKALEQLRTEELKRRKEFKQRVGKFLPLDKIPGLEDPLIDFELTTKTFPSQLPQIDSHYIKDFRTYVDGFMCSHLPQPSESRNMDYIHPMIEQLSMYVTEIDQMNDQYRMVLSHLIQDTALMNVAVPEGKLKQSTVSVQELIPLNKHPLDNMTEKLQDLHHQLLLKPGSMVMDGLEKELLKLGDELKAVHSEPFIVTCFNFCKATMRYCRQALYQFKKEIGSSLEDMSIILDRLMRQEYYSTEIPDILKRYELSISNVAALYQTEGKDDELLKVCREMCTIASQLVLSVIQ